MNEIQSGRFNAVLHKLLDMKEGAPAPMLASEIFPVIVIESDRPEWDFLQGIRNQGTNAAIAAVAAQRSKFRLRNPTGSGAIAVVESIVLRSDTTSLVRLHVGTVATDYSSTFTGINRDTRDDVSGAVIPSSENSINASTLGSQFAAVHLRADDPYTLQFPRFIVALAPGGAMDVFTNVNNAALTVSVEWRERALEASETR